MRTKVNRISSSGGVREEAVEQWRPPKLRLSVGRSFDDDDEEEKSNQNRTFYLYVKYQRANQHKNFMSIYFRVRSMLLPRLRLFPPRNHIAVAPHSIPSPRLTQSVDVANNNVPSSSAGLKFHGN